MPSVRTITDTSELDTLKAKFFEASAAPLDGMWHFGFVPTAHHFGIYHAEQLIGFFCINEEGYLLQFYICPTSQLNVADIFRHILTHSSDTTGVIKGAFVSTAELQLLSLCLDNNFPYQVNALMYKNSEHNADNGDSKFTMHLANKSQLEQCVEFAHEAIGAPKNWLTQYYGNLISRQELWCYSNGDNLIAAGECRKFEKYQTEYADLGVIVSKQHRGNGLATNVLIFLKRRAKDIGLTAICSTEKHNIAAQIAISKSGMVSYNRILQFEFNHG